MKIEVCTLISRMTSALHEGIDCTIMHPNSHGRGLIYTTNYEVIAHLKRRGHEGVRNFFPGVPDIVVFEDIGGSNTHIIIEELKQKFSATVQY